MKKQHTRTLLGIGIVTFGVAVFLGNINIININDFTNIWWPLVLMTIGAILFINRPSRFLLPITLFSIGLLIGLDNFNIIDFKLWQLVGPIITVSIGLSFLLHKRDSDKNEPSYADFESITSVFSGNTVKNQSEDYKGSEVTAVFGGASLDLRSAKIGKKATVSVTAVFGGVDIIVPKDWIIKSDVITIAGGIEDKTKNEGSKNSPTLIVTGSAVFGGVDIKN